MTERSRVQLPAAALSGNDVGQVVHTNVSLLITKQYNLVPCESFYVNAPVCGSHWRGSNEQGGIVRRVPRIFVRGGHDDGGTEGPERGAEARSAAAPRGWGLRRGAVCPQKIFEKSTLKLQIFVRF